MSSILDRYGIKEVADCTFYTIDANGNPAIPVLFLDTLKVSTIEETAEEATARGGKGNAKLISWDYGKEINVTLEDALFSAKSLAIMFSGSNNPAAYSGVNNAVSRVTTFIAEGTSTYHVSVDVYDSGVGITRKRLATSELAANHITAGTIYDESGNSVAANALVLGKKYFLSYSQTITAGSSIEVSASAFPGTYWVEGVTYSRSEASGKDELFQFIIKKAKIAANQTITLQAEGDPSVFNLNLTVLRPADGIMMELRQYGLANA